MARARSVLFVVLCASVPVNLALSLSLSSCGPSEADAAFADAGDEKGKQREREADIDEPDAATQVDAARPPPVIPGCVGTRLPLEITDQRAYVRIGVGARASLVADAGPDADAAADAAAGEAGAFVVDFGSTGSTIDLGAYPEGGAPMPTTCAGDAGAPGADCTFDGFDFFGEWGFVNLRTADYSILVGAVRQAGIVGTDFLSLNPFTLDYARAQIWRADGKAFCTDAELLGAGMVPLSSAGFYTTDLSKLRPLSDVITDPDAGTAHFTVPNVPTVPVSIAGVSALAQLDTGYDDRLVHHSINVNEALFELIQQNGPDLITRAPNFDLYATTCVPGLSEKLIAYKLAEGRDVAFVGEGGSVVRREPTAVIHLKKRVPETQRCGGIATWTVPAAQVGASFFVDAQAIVFDPARSRVWLPKN